MLQIMFLEVHGFGTRTGVFDLTVTEDRTTLEHPECQNAEADGPIPANGNSILGYLDASKSVNITGLSSNSSNQIVGPASWYTI